MKLPIKNMINIKEAMKNVIPLLFNEVKRIGSDPQQLQKIYILVKQNCIKDPDLIPAILNIAKVAIKAIDDLINEIQRESGESK